MKRYSTLDGIKGLSVFIIACVFHYGVIFSNKYGIRNVLPLLMFMISGYLSYIVYSSKIVLRQLSMERFYFHRFSRMFLGLVISSTVMEIGQLIYIVSGRRN